MAKSLPWTPLPPTVEKTQFPAWQKCKSQTKAAWCHCKEYISPTEMFLVRKMYVIKVSMIMKYTITTITHCRPTHGTVQMSHRSITVTRQQESNQTSLFKMIAKLERTQKQGPNTARMDVASLLMQCITTEKQSNQINTLWCDKKKWLTTHS